MPSAAAWKLAPSLQRLLDQLNIIYPNRSKAHDGTIGDQAHAARVSDHNPDERGFVNAIDVTHDPANGVDCGQIAAALVRSHDPRIAYLIWNRRICSSTVAPWVWRPYNGANPHDKHLHVSVRSDERDWSIGGK